MSAEWPVIELRELVDPARGISYGIVQPGSHKPDGVPIVRVSDVRANRIDTDRPLRVDASIDAKHSRTKLRGGELLITIVGTVGQTAIVPESMKGWNVARAIAVLPIRRELDPRWVLLALEAPAIKSRIAARLNTTVQSTLNLGDLATLPVAMPPEKQRAGIVAVMGALDDKIDLNRRMNETLEAMARAIFKDWFVDFGPTRAKLEGRPAYLAAELWSQFPGSVDALDVPVGWVVRPLDQIADFLNGLALQKFPPSGAGDLPVIKIAQLRAGAVDGCDWAGATVPSAYIVEDGDVLFSWSGSLLQRIWAGGRGALNQHLFKVTSRSVPKWMHYFWVDHHLPEFQAIAASKATTMGHIQRGHLSSANTILPDPAILNAADELIRPMFDQIHANALASRTLADIRDLLLPELLSGKVRMIDAQRLAETAM